MLYSNMEPSTMQTTKSELNDIDKEKEKQARENHCEIERRRRVKMAAYFNELCSMVPTCNTLQRKPDKLTILRMASSHMRALRGHNQILSNDNTYKPSFLTDQELKYLILEAADGFLFVAQCDSGNIIYVSDTIQQVLCYSSNDWYHRSLFDFVHIDDLEKVKEQLSSQETNTIGRILDLKTGTVKKEGHPNTMRSHMGSRRAFICRIRVGSYNNHAHQQQIQHHYNYNQQQQNGFNYINRPNIHNNALGDTNTNVDGNNYTVVHITGYTKSWPPINNNSNSNTLPMDCHDTNNNDNHNQNNNSQFCLVAIARIQATNIPNETINLSNIEFVTRVDQNGIITFADQRITQILGYQTSDVLKKPIYDICILQDQNILKDQIKLLHDTKSTQPLVMQIHMKSINQEIYTFKVSSYAFTNPYNDEFEFIVCTFTLQKPNDINNSVILDPTLVAQQTIPQPTVNNTNLINNNSSSSNYSLQHIDSTKQPNYSPYMLSSNNSQETYQNLYANQQTATSALSGRPLVNTSTPSSTPSSVSSNSASSTTSSSSSSTSTPPLTQTTQSQTPPSNATQQFNIQQQRNSTLISTNTNLTWPNYDQQPPNTTSSSILVQNNTNTTVLPSSSSSSSTSNLINQTTQYLRSTPTQYNTQMIAQPQQQTPAYSDWVNNTQLTNNLLLNNNNWQQMNITSEQQNCDLLSHHYQQQPQQLQHLNIQQQSLLSNTNQTPSTNLTDQYNYQYMTM